MAISAERLGLQAREVLGISPRRLMMVRPSGIRHPAMPKADGRSLLMRRIDRFLVGLRRAGRRAILIVDTDCGDGQRLIDAANRARALGFVGIDARGYDNSPDQVAAATEAAARCSDPAIGFSFAVLDKNMSPAPDEGGDDRADLVLAGLLRSRATIADLLDASGIIIRHR